MREKWEEWLLTSIRRREAVIKPALKISKILEVEGLPVGYLRMCTDRICDAELIDGEEVRMFMEDLDDLELTADGLIDCRGILKNYISAENLIDAFEALQECETLWRTATTVAEALKRMDLLQLARTYKRDTNKAIRRYVLEEVKQRFPWSQWTRRMRSNFYDLYIRVKYHRVLSACKEAFSGAAQG